MKISELIVKLYGLQLGHGDLTVRAGGVEGGDPIEEVWFEAGEPQTIYIH